MSSTEGSVKGGGSLRVSAELADLRDDEQRPALAAYAFSAGGKLLQAAALDKGGDAELRLEGDDTGDAVRVVVGPEVDAKDEHALADLFRVGAAERMVRLDVKDLDREIRFTLPRPDWLCWLRGRCTVRGTLLKRAPLGGTDLPVCDAEVEVYEVDPVWIILPRIPIELIDRLRHVIKVPPPEEDPHIHVPPRPGPDPGPLRELLAAAGDAAAIPTPQPPFPHTTVGGDFVTRQELMQLAQDRFGEQERERGDSGAGTEDREGAGRTVDLVREAVVAEDAEARLARVGDVVGALATVDSMRIAAADSAGALRSALLARPDLLRPLLCVLFPRFVTTQLVATTTTDECGHFRTVFWRGCGRDQPDLYFVAYRRIFGLRIPIYRPTPIACNTWWDYACGTEVTLYTTHPFAHTCPPCKPVVAGERWVLVMAIGNLPLSRIHGTGATLSGGAADIGLTDSGAPFGGLLRLRLDFDNALRALGVRYYRVQWKRAGVGHPYVPLDLECHRHYAFWQSGVGLVLQSFSLGPHVVGGVPGLFEIPPAVPPLGPGGEASQWTIPDAVEDTTNAKFPTGGSRAGTYGLVPPGSEGIYKLRVDLFDAGGAPVSLGALNIHFVVPTSTDLSGTIFTTEASGLGLVPTPPVDNGNAFVMRLHVDNQPTQASIAAPLLNGSTAANACGVIEYANAATDQVTLSYTGAHPNGFATYAFTLMRGVTVLTPPSASGPVGSGPTTATPTVGSLLGSCPVAGFAEALSVLGTATDGWSRQGYDASDLRAFVLTQPC